jgi:hypothetical protein
MASHLISLSAGGHFIEPPASEVQGAWKAGAQLLRNRDGWLSPGRFLLSAREFVAHTATVKNYQTSHQTNSKCRLAKNRYLSAFFRATSLSSFLYIYSLSSLLYIFIYIYARQAAGAGEKRDTPTPASTTKRTGECNMCIKAGSN